MKPILSPAPKDLHYFMLYFDSISYLLSANYIDPDYIFALILFKVDSWQFTGQL